MEADAVVQIDARRWLRIPLGKLRNDRYVPLDPWLTGLLAAWTAANLKHISRCKRAWSPTTPARWTATSSAASSPASPGPPGSLACTRTGCATRWPPNRGMRLDVSAALLGHRKMEMTLIYAHSRELHQPGEKPQVTTPDQSLRRIGSGARRRRPADLHGFLALPSDA